MFSRVTSRVRTKCASSGRIKPASCSEPHDAEFAFHRPGGNAANLRVAALLVVVDVAAFLADQFVAGPAMRTDGDQIRHRPAGHEQRRLLAQPLGNDPLQAEDRGVVAQNVVAHLGGRHRRAHRRGGPGDGIAAKIEDFIVHKCPLEGGY